MLTPKITSSTAKKRTVKKAATELLVEKKLVKKLAYLYAVGRRKTSTARVRLFAKDEKKGIVVNEKNYTDYFPYFQDHGVVEAPLKKVDAFGKYFITVRVQGGGIKSQAGAVAHGISRALLKLDENLRKTLRSEGFLTRDSRKKERKKPGLKRARRAPQWAKR